MRAAGTRGVTLRSCGLGTTGTSAEGLLPVRHSRPWSVFGGGDAPRVQCICCFFFTNRRLTTWLIVASTNAVLIVSPYRSHSP